jgi:hypothetical protein
MVAQILPDTRALHDDGDPGRLKLIRRADA